MKKLTGIIIIITAPVILMAQVWRGSCYSSTPFHGFFPGFGGGFFMYILTFILAGLLIFYFIKNNKNSVNGRSIEILKERYARGEITKQEFNEMKSDIS